jgi:hypothetical protein
MQINELLRTEIRKSDNVLDAAWLAANQRTSIDRLEAFTANLKPFLDYTELTRPRFPAEFYSLGINAQEWRTICLQRLIATLAIIHEEHGKSLIGEGFWNDQFPAFWLANNRQASSSPPPPIAPSRFFPSSNKTKLGPTAYRDTYQQWVNEELMPRLNGLSTWMSNLPPREEFSCSSAMQLHELGNKLSAATAIQSGQKLRLTFQGTSLRDLLHELLNSKKVRRQSATELLWPDDKKHGRCWADLYLSPSLRQIVRYTPNHWDAPAILSLGVTNRVNQQRSGSNFVPEAEIDQLHYWHIRLAVTCETFLRHIHEHLVTDQGGIHSIMSIESPSPSRIPDAINPLTIEMLSRIEQPSPNKRENTERFSEPKNNNIRQLLQQSENHYSSSYCFGIPDALLCPILENNNLSFNLDPNWLASQVSSLEVILLAVQAGQKTIEMLEYNGGPDGGTPGEATPQTLRLCGEYWNMLNRRYASADLEAAWEENSIFAVKRDVLGTGFILVGLVRLPNIPACASDA